MCNFCRRNCCCDRSCCNPCRPRPVCRPVCFKVCVKKCCPCKKFDGCNSYPSSYNDCCKREFNVICCCCD